MEEDKKDKGGSGSASEPKDTEKFVEIKGEKFVEDPKNPGKALIDDDGNLVPFIPKGGEGDDIDFKAELDKANEIINKKDKSLEKAGLKIRGLENDVKSNLSEERVKEMIKESSNEVYAKVSEKDSKDMAYSMTDSPDEAKLTLFHYKNSIVKTGDLSVDMRTAHAIANKSKLTKTVEEMGRILDSKKDLGGQGGVGEKKEIKKTGRPTLSESDERLIRSIGLTWDEKENGWVGKSGKIYKHIPRGEGPATLEGFAKKPE